MADTFPTASPKAKAIGDRVAREAFRKRGNLSEIHISELDMAAWCQVAAQLAIKLAAPKT